MKSNAGLTNEQDQEVEVFKLKAQQTTVAVIFITGWLYFLATLGVLIFR